MATSTELNALMRFLEFLFSPEAAFITNTADPLAIASEQMGDISGNSMLQMYMDSDNDSIASVFVDIAEGKLDPISAKQRLYAENPELETSWINTAVNDAFDEISSSSNSGGSSSSSKKKTKYQEAYLPDPLESYMARPEMAPLLPKAAQFMEPVEQSISRIRETAPSMLEMRESGQVPTRTLKDVVNKVGKPSGPVDYFPGIQDEGIKSRLSAMPKGEQMKLYVGLQQKRAEQNRLKKDIFQKNAASLDAGGRTPLQDALLKRLAGLGGAGLK
jgi:hypothetical protein